MFPHAAGPDAETLARAAEAARVDTALWTHETFGARQAVACEEDLIARCRASAAGTAPSQDCRRLVDPDLPGDRRFVRAGQHVIVVMENAAAVIILDVRHGRADLRDASGSAGWRSRPDSLTPGAEPNLG